MGPRQSTGSAAITGDGARHPPASVVAPRAVISLRLEGEWPSARGVRSFDYFRQHGRDCIVAGVADAPFPRTLAHGPRRLRIIEEGVERLRECAGICRRHDAAAPLG